jgi:RimJ/RimL family protein N-acetyltransferase
MDTPPLRFSTPRLDVIAGTATIARADASDRARFSTLLDAVIPASWPPSTMADVQEYFAEQLEKGLALPGWWSWYAVLHAPRTLVACGGFMAQPDDQGTVTLGYSVTEGYERQGYATELTAGLLQWLAGTGRVKRVHATTFERHYGSIRVMEKNGFECRGVSSEDAAASEDDRQGRGSLMLFVREMES